MKLIKAMPKTKPEAIISNHSSRKTLVQLLKELGYSDSAMMLITRHKSQKGLIAYKHSKLVIQHEVFLFDAPGDHDDNEAPGNHDDGKAPHDYEAPSGYGNPKGSSNNW
ncbi:14317_t:CDS:2 [Gigaspora margarita]|uniref:14317_t:CDS:1 n=1 Tax=Gigaspora margarita TaxID=4874 RepID=A0ABN7UEU1_GIGMA|nr:14317_t:CDS:2 [Gigaspora margarita]